MAEEKQEEVKQEEYSEKFGEDLLNELDDIEFVSQDGAEEETDTSEEEETSKPEEKTDKTEKEKKEGEDKKPEESDFDFVKADEKGEKVFDTESALNFMTAKQEKKLETKEPVETPAKVEEKKDDEPTYEDNIESNLMAGIKLVKEYIEAGHDVNSAIMYAERDLRGDIKSHLQDRQFNEKLGKIDEREKVLTEKAELAEARPKSSININEAVKQGNWGTREKLESALFNRELGGQFLTKQFERENPDKKFKSVAEYTNALNDWFIKMSSDRDSLKLAEMVARAAIVTRNLPKILEQARNIKVKVDKQNKKADVKSDKTINRKTTTEKNTLTEWLENEGH